MRRPNILRVITWLPVGGIERRLVAVLPRLREHANVQVVCLRERGPLAAELEAAGVPVTLIPFRSRWDPLALRRLARHMREQRIDLVHSHMYRANVPATVAARLAGVPAVWCQVHNVHTWETARQAWMDRQLCRWRTGVVAVSERVRQDVIATLRLAPERVRVIHNGVDLARFQFTAEERAALRANLGVGERQIVILFAARLVPQKRCAALLRALATIQAAHPRPDFKCLIAGEGPERDHLEHLARALPHPAAVTFLGRRDDVPELMAASDVFVLPSTREGFSNALVEAMASGLASIASDAGGNAEAIRDGVDGLIIPPDDDEPLRAALTRLLGDDALRVRVAASARARAELFSLDQMLLKLLDLYQLNPAA